MVVGGGCGSGSGVVGERESVGYGEGGGGGRGAGGRASGVVVNVWKRRGEGGSNGEHGGHE